jgi:hypothetical protein
MINPALPGGREIGFQNRQAAFAADGLQECATAYTGEVPQCYIVSAHWAPAERIVRRRRDRMVETCLAGSTRASTHVHVLF